MTPTDRVRDQRVFLGFGKAKNEESMAVCLKVLSGQQAYFDHILTVLPHIMS